MFKLQLKLIRRLLDKLERSNTESLTGDGQITICCGADIDLVKVGTEVFVRCRKCRKYIGNVVGRNISLLETHYEANMAKACGERPVALLPSPSEMEAMYPMYCDYLNQFSMQAARSTLRDYIPIE